MHNIPKSGKIFLVKTSPENIALKHSFNFLMAARTKTVRKASGLGAPEVAAHLHVKLNTYYTYERFVAMPVYLIPRFLAFTGGNPAYMMGFSKEPRRANLIPVH